MTLKELSRFMKLCREQGVDSIEFQDVKINFGHTPVKMPKTKAVSDVMKAMMASAPQELIPTPDALTEEDMLFYSATGQTPSQDT